MNKNQRNEVINFGKYRGKTIGYVFENDPEYLKWANENVEHFELNDFFYYAVEEACQKIHTDKTVELSWGDKKGY